MTTETSQRTKDICRITLVGSVCNLLLTLFKLIAGILGCSAAMLADALHSLSDFITDFVVLIFVRMAGAPKDAGHEFGHGKYETLGTAVISLLLISVALGIFWNGAEEIMLAMSGETLQRPGMIAFYAAIVSIVVKELLYHYTAIGGRKLSSSALVANAWHHRSDALSSVGTALGISGAMFLGESWRVLDPIAAIVVSILICRTGVKLLRPCIDELMEKSLSDDDVRQIEAIILSHSEIYEPHNLRTRRIGNYCAIDVHFRMEGKTPLEEVHNATLDVESQLRKKFGPATIIYTHVEPLKHPINFAQ